MDNLTWAAFEKPLVKIEKVDFQLKFRSNFRESDANALIFN